MRCCIWKYLGDVLSMEEARSMLNIRQPTEIEERVTHLKENGMPAYTTACGWLHYSNEEITKKTIVSELTVSTKGQNKRSNIGDSANRTARHDYARIYEKLTDRIIPNKKKQTNI